MEKASRRLKTLKLKGKDEGELWDGRVRLGGGGGNVLLKNIITYGEDGKSPINVRADYHYHYFLFLFLFLEKKKTGRANPTRQTRREGAGKSVNFLLSATLSLLIVLMGFSVRSWGGGR